MSTPPEFRLQRLIKEAIKREKSVYALMEQINRANAQAGLTCRVGRRTLQKLSECPSKVKLTLDTLIAINTYLALHGQSLQDWPIFEKQGVLDQIGTSEHVYFLLGSKPRKAERRDDISRWDNLALAESLTSVSRFSNHNDFQIVDVICRAPATAQSVAEDRFQAALQDDRASVISIGSPLAALSSEVMLARMFGVEPFEKPALDPEHAPLPFYFGWRPKLAGKFRSAFGLTWRDFKDKDPKLAAQLRSNEVSVFFCGKKRFLVPAREKRWTIPGIIAAQRRAAGNVWLVVAGLAGPATYAAAACVKNLTSELPWKKGTNSDVLWALIKAQVRVDKDNKIAGDVRRVCNFGLASGPMTYSVT